MIATVEHCSSPRDTGVKLKIHEILTGPAIAEGQITLPNAKCYWHHGSRAYPFDPGSIALYALVVRDGQSAPYFNGQALDFLQNTEVESVARRLREIRAFWGKSAATKRTLLSIWLASDITQLQNDALSLISNLDGIENDPRNNHPPTFDAPLTEFEGSAPLAREAGSWTKQFLHEILNIVRPSTDYDVMRKALRAAELEIQGNPDHPAFQTYIAALKREADGETPQRVSYALTRLSHVK